MLEPGQRLLYLDEIRPPSGFRLDQAIATTYSTDLLALLTVPLALVKFEAGDPEAQLREPVAILEALRRTRNCFTLFCQQGRIAHPRTDSRLYSYLEPAVTEVRAPNPDGAFHPKCWLLRFVGQEPGAENGDEAVESVRYRFICLSRNLTFDHSWDLAVCLEGNLDQDRQKGFGENRPLGDFFAALPTMAINPMTQEALQRVELMANEVRRVKFQGPEFCDRFEFLPSGIKDYRNLKPISSPADARRIVTISPFLSERTLTELMRSGANESSDKEEKNFLISRVDALDGLSVKTIEMLRRNTELFLLDPAAEQPEGDTVGELSSSGEAAGLHAKLYLADYGWDSELTLGSANATQAGLGGQNVELAVRLTGKKSRFGINQFLASGDNQESFRMMLQPYERMEERVARALLRRQCEAMLDETADAIITAAPRLVVTPESSGHQLALSTKKKVVIPEGITAFCHPVSLPSAQQRSLQPLAQGLPVLFPGLSLESLIRFMSFHLTTDFEGKPVSRSFVLNLPVEGMPEGRDTAILHHLISSPDRFVRYLLFLLADPDDPVIAGSGIGIGAENSSNGDHSGVAGIPLLETLVRICSRHPERLAPIDKLVTEFLANPDGKSVLPPGFEALWKVMKGSGNPRASHE